MSINIPTRAFLPAVDPLQRFTANCFLDELVAELPSLLAAGRARGVLSRVPVVDVERFKTKAEQERALAILSVLGHAAVHESWRTGSSSSVPKEIAMPWVSLASKMGRFPVLTYASHGLNNWRRLEPNGPIELGNLGVLFNFYGGLDENWFVASHVEIEALAAPMVSAALEAQNAIPKRNVETIGSALITIEETLLKMMGSLQRVRIHCDPDIFFNRVQPFMQGMKNVVYEGVKELGDKPQNYPGGSGAQSTILPLIDAVLGIRHAQDPLLHYLMDLRRFMPPEHLALLTEAEIATSVREFLAEEPDSDLIEKYDRCIEALGNFRAEHLKMSIEYIQKPARKSASSRGEVGTGGSPFVGYLRKHREETFNHCLKKDVVQMN